MDNQSREGDGVGNGLLDMEEHVPTNVQQLTETVMTAAKSSRQTRRFTPSLSLLKLDNMKLHGREEDIKLLKSKLHDNIILGTDGAGRHELVLIAGVSGTGKTALVKRGIEEQAKKMGISFASGKFDLNKSSTSHLSAFADAMSSLTKQVMSSQEGQTIRSAIKEVLTDDDMASLVNVMPGCEELFRDDKSEQVNESRRRTSVIGLTKSSADAYNDRRPALNSVGKAAVKKVQYAIRMLFRVICSNLKGVVLFIDDLQWSDVATLELLKEIAIDNNMTSLLLVGAYREDEVSESHPLLLQIKECQSNDVDITTITIGNLTLNNVNALVAEALRMEDNEEAVRNLATTIYRKTGGNAFFVLEFLKSLHAEELLEYNFGRMKWIWDDDVIRTKLVTENVATILINKLKRFSKSSQMALKVAACLGASFNLSLVALVMKRMSDDDGSDDATFTFSSISAEEFEEDGLWEAEIDSQDKRRFGHDQIQSASLKLIPPSKRNSFRRDIGDILSQQLNPNDLEDYLFEVVSLRNCETDSLSVRDSKELAKMNLRAGLKGSRNAAFDSAAIYYRIGRELLGKAAWSDDKDTMLQLCSNEAEARFINGDLKTMKLLIDEVISKDISIEDKFKAYEIKILALNAEADFKAAIDTAIEVRTKLGLPTPANKPATTVNVLKEYMKTSWVLGNRTPEELGSLPELTNTRIIMGQRMLELLLTATYQGQPSIYPLISFLLIRATIKFGVNASSCDAFSTYGLLLCGAFEKFSRGRDMGRATELLLENPNYERMQSRSCFHIETLINHWTSPLHLSLSPLLSGYQKGLESGDIESAGICLSFRTMHLWYSGRSLGAIVHEMQTNADVLGLQLKQQSFYCCALIFLSSAKNLAGDESVGFHEILRLAVGNSMCLALTRCTQIELHVIMNEMDVAMDILQQHSSLGNDIPGFFTGARLTVMEGLINLKAAQTSTSKKVRKKYEKEAQKAIKSIKNVNLIHAQHLLKAELAALRGRTTLAEKEYKLAITMSSTSGFLQDKGLSHELAGRYFVDQDDAYWAEYHIDQAIEAFSDWGAVTKVKRLEEQRVELMRNIGQKN